MGEGEKIVSANILYSYHSDLGQRPMPERIAKRIDLGDCRRRKNPVGIRREPVTVADLHVGNLLHTVRPGSRPQKRKQHSEAKYRQNKFFILLNYYAHFRNREAVAASQNGLPVAGKCTKNPADLHRPGQNPKAPARHPLIDMRTELHAFARQGVRITSGVDSRIEIGMYFIRRYVQ